MTEPAAWMEEKAWGISPPFHLCMAALRLRCCVQAFSRCDGWGWLCLWCQDFSLWRLLLLQSVGSTVVALRLSWGAVFLMEVVETVSHQSLCLEMRVKKSEVSETEMLTWGKNTFRWSFWVGSLKVIQFPPSHSMDLNRVEMIRLSEKSSSLGGLF